MFDSEKSACSRRTTPVPRTCTYPLPTVCRVPIHTCIAPPDPFHHIRVWIVDFSNVALTQNLDVGYAHRYLGACAKSPTALVWEGVGTACYRLGLLADAEEALAESNIYDSTNARVWGFLALICTRTGRRVEAEQAFNFARARNLNDETLLGEIRAAQQMAGFGNPYIDE